MNTLKLWFADVHLWEATASKAFTVTGLLTYTCTHRKLLNICLVSSDERELEKVMKEQ